MEVGKEMSEKGIYKYCQVQCVRHKAPSFTCTFRTGEDRACYLLAQKTESDPLHWLAKTTVRKMFANVGLFLEENL